MGIKERITNWLLTPSTDITMRGGLLPMGSEATRLYNYGALFSVAYLACEQTKARSLASLPVCVHRKTARGNEPLPDHPLSLLLGRRPNDLMSASDLMHWTSIRRDTFGDAYWYVEWSKGVPVAIWPITSYVKIDYNRHAAPGHRLRYAVHDASTVKGVGVTVPPGNYFAGEVVHFRTAVTQDGIHGRSLAEYAAQEIGLSVDLERFYSAMLNNGNHHLGHVETPEKLNPDQISRVKEAVRDKAGVGKAGEAPVFTAGAKWVTEQQTMKDASLIEQQQWVLQQVCRATSVPPQKVYELSRQTYSNAESARVDYATDTIMPEAGAIEDELTSILDAAGETDLFVKFDPDGLMRGDKAAQGQWYREMTYSGVYTRNEVREKEGLNPIEGLEKPLVPVNYGVVEADGSVTVLSSTSSEPASGMQTGTTD